MSVKKKLLAFYDRLIYLKNDFYDLFARKKVTVSIGDFMLNRGNVDGNQFLVASRLLDVEAYCEKGDASFYHQKTTTNNPNYNEEKFRAAFVDLIESYCKQGYNGKSRFLLDKNKILRNGTHRTAMHLYLKIYTAKGLVVDRKWPEFDVSYQRFEHTLSADFFNSVLQRLTQIEEQLVNDGVTFNALIPANISISEAIPSIKNDLHVLKEIRLEQPNKDKHNKLVLFRLDDPQYIVSSGFLQSKKIIDAFKADNYYKFEVSRSCYEGKKMYDLLTPYFVKEENVIGE